MNPLAFKSAARSLKKMPNRPIAIDPIDHMSRNTVPNSSSIFQLYHKRLSPDGFTLFF